MLPRSISHGLFDAPSSMRTGIENFDDQSRDLDMNNGGSPTNFPGNVLHDPQWDKYYDMVHDAAGGGNVSFGALRGQPKGTLGSLNDDPGAPSNPGADPNWWARGIDPNTSNPQMLKDAIPASLRGLYKAGQ